MQGSDAVTKSNAVYQLLNEGVEIAGREGITKVYVNWDSEKVRYISTNADGEGRRYFESTVHPEKLSKEQRHRVLHYMLSRFDDDEIVNYNDLFIQGEFITEGVVPEQYELTEHWCGL